MEQNETNQDIGYTVHDLGRAIGEIMALSPSVYDIRIPHTPITSDELAAMLLLAPNSVIRDIADEAKRTGVAPFGRRFIDDL